MPQIRSLALLALLAVVLAVVLAACAIGLSPSADRRATGDMGTKPGAQLSDWLKEHK
jgi:predicted lipoprotein